MKTKGQDIRELRIERKWTQERLGKEIGVSKQMISGYEKNSYPPTDVIMEKICKVFEVDPSYFWAREYEAEEDKQGIIEELRSTVDYVKGQIDMLNNQLAASTAEKARLLDTIDWFKSNFPEGSIIVSTGSKNPEYTPLKMAA